MAENPPEPADQRLQGTHRVGGRFAVPHLVDEHRGRHRTAGAQRENGQQGAQPRPPMATAVPSSWSACVVPRML